MVCLGSFAIIYPMETKIVEKYFFFGLLLATIIFSFFIFQPFWVVLTLGMSFAIVLYPLYEWFKKIKFPSWLASFLTVFLFTIVLCGPLLGIGTLVFNQSQDIYNNAIETGNVGPLLDSIEDKVNKILPIGVNLNIHEKSTEFIAYISENVTNIFSSTVSAFFAFILMLLIIFYFLKDGNSWKKAIIILSPLNDKEDEKIMSRLAFAVNAVIKGYLLVALIQGVLMGFGLWIFNIPNPALWGVVAAVASLLPTIGTALVSVPAIIFLFATGSTLPAIGLICWSVVVVGLIDNFLSPFILGRKINIPSLFILFSILGGISLLGPVGILIGPLVISLLYTLISIYRNEFKQNSII